MITQRDLFVHLLLQIGLLIIINIIHRYKQWDYKYTNFKIPNCALNVLLLFLLHCGVSSYKNLIVCCSALNLFLHACCFLAHAHIYVCIKEAGLLAVPPQYGVSVQKTSAMDALVYRIITVIITCLLPECPNARSDYS